MHQTKTETECDPTFRHLRASNFIYDQNHSRIIFWYRDWCKKSRNLKIAILKISIFLYQSLARYINNIFQHYITKKIALIRDDVPDFYIFDWINSVYRPKKTVATQLIYLRHQTKLLILLNIKMKSLKKHLKHYFWILVMKTGIYLVY